VSSRYLSIDDAKTVKSRPKTLILHTPTNRFELSDFTFNEHTLEGNLKTYSKGSKPKIDVYVGTKFDLNSSQNPDNHIIIKRTEFEYITYTTNNFKKTVVLIGAGLTALLFIGLIQSNWLSFDMNWD
jgi:hypothetical protein